MKKYLWAVFAPLLVLAACSDKGKTAGEPSTPAAPAGTAQKRVVRLAMSGDYAPISTLNEKSQLVGFERDLLTAVGAAEGFTVETNRYLMPMWEAELFGAKSDVLSLTFGVPPEAREKMALSRPILKSRLVVGMLDKGQQWNVADLRGKTISVNKLDGPEAVELAEKLTGSPDKVIVSNTFPLSAAQVYGGKADGVLAENMVFSYYSRSGKRAEIPVKTIDLPNQPERDLVFAVRREDAALMEKINRGLDTVRSNGTYDRIAIKWIRLPGGR